MEIKINIDDERLFCDIAPVVDRDDFLEEIERIRATLKINTPLNKTQYLEFIAGIYETPVEGQLKSEIEESRKRLHLPIVFRQLIKKAALCGVVEKDDYKTAYLDHIIDDHTNQGGDVADTYVIVLSPTAEDRDVLNALRQYRKNEHGYYVMPSWKKDKTKSSFKKYREWYFAVKNGGTIPDICDKENISCPIVEPHDIKKGNKKQKGCTCYSESTIRKGFATYQTLVRNTSIF